MTICPVCSSTFNPRPSNVKRGGGRYCSRECMTTGVKVHGHSRPRSRTYKSWLNMMQRCNNPNCHKWKDYGARGIKVCTRWLAFSDFLADMGVRPEGKTLDRKNNHGNYEPGNCRWATPLEQSRNARFNVMLTFNEKTMTLAEWADVVGMKHATLQRRITTAKMGIEDALTIPVGGIRWAANP